MTEGKTVTCHIRYELDLNKLEDFKAYARAWMQLIERHGGTHHGYFLPRAIPSGAQISFPGVGAEGPANIAIATFTFPDEAAYLRYRETVAADPGCKPAAAIFEETHCFTSYERLFLQPLT